MSAENHDREEHARVVAKLSPFVMAFYRDNHGEAFYADDLLNYVRQSDPYCAPDSPGRTLRELRLEGKLNYVVINRRHSLYLFLPEPPRLPNMRPGDGGAQPQMI